MEINKYYLATFYAQFVVEKESFKEIQSLLAYNNFSVLHISCFIVYGSRM